MKLNFKRLITMLLSIIMVVSVMLTVVFVTQAAEAFPAYIGETGYESLQDAIDNANDGDTITLADDVDALPAITKAITIDGANHNVAKAGSGNHFGTIDGTVTIKNVNFTDGTQAIRTDYKNYDYSNMTLVLEGCTFNGLTGYAVLGGSTADNGGTVLGSLILKNCTFNAGEKCDNYMVYAQCVKSLTVTGCTFNGNNVTKGAIHTGDSTVVATVAEISGCSIDGVERGVQICNRVDGSSVSVDDVAFDGVTAEEGKKTGAIYVYDYATAPVVATNNTFTDCTNVVSTNSSTEGFVAKIVTEFTGNTADGTNLVMNADGTVAKSATLGVAYVSASYLNGVGAVFGEATCVVGKESFVVKLYADGVLIGTATLNDTDKVLLNGESRSITWHAALKDDGDDWWITEWVNGAINIDAIPDTAELWVDGDKKDTCSVELNINDLEKPIFAAMTDANGGIESFVAGTGYLNGVGTNVPVYSAAFNTAAQAGGNIVMLRDIYLSGTNNFTVDETITIDLNGHNVDFGANRIQIVGGNVTVTGEGTISGSATMIFIVRGAITDEGANYSVLTIDKDVTLKTGASTYGVVIGYQTSGNPVNGIYGSYGAVVTINGTIEGGHGLHVNGTINSTTGNVPVLTVNGKIATSGDIYPAIYGAGYAKYTINGTVSGTSGVEIRAGELTVTENSVITATADFAEPANGQSSPTARGGVAVLLSQHSTKNPINITVESGATLTASGANGKAFYQTNLTGSESVNISASIAAGASLTGAVEAAEEGFKMLKAADGSYSLDKVEEVELWSIGSSNIVLGNEFAMWFYVANENLDGTDYVAVIIKSYADGRSDLVVEIPYSEWEATTNNRMRFKFNGIAAKEMSDNISVVVKTASTGEAVSEVYNDSIRDYVERGFRLGYAQMNDKLATMLVDMLNYGAAAQKIFEYGTDDLANKNMTEYQSYATQSVSCENNQVGTGYKSASLTLESSIQFNMKFCKTSVTQDMTAVVSFTDHYGNKHNIEISGDKFVSDEDTWSIVVEELVVADFRQLVTCTFKDADGNVVQDVSGVDSMESFCARAIAGGGGSPYEDIAKFMASSYNYFHNTTI